MTTNADLQHSLTFALPVDHLPQEIRHAMDELDEIQIQRLPKQERTCERLELSLATASMDSVDGGDQEYASILITPAIRTELGILSDAVDKLVANIDAIDSHGDDNVRGRKKELSQQLVQLMARVDLLIAQVQTEPDSS